jgi:hypothetical protein
LITYLNIIISMINKGKEYKNKKELLLKFNDVLSRREKKGASPGLLSLFK